MFTIGSIFIEVFLLSIMVARGFLIGLIGQKLCQHALDVVQGFLLSPGSLLLSFHAVTKIIIIVIGHIDRYKPCLDRLIVLEQA